MPNKQPVDLEEAVIEHQGLVKSIVKRFSVSAFDRDDLMQAGFMGLIDALRGFDPAKGYAFSTYATPFILGAIRKELISHRLVPISRHFRQIVKKVQSSSPLLSLEDLALSCETTPENIVLALNYQPHVITLDEERLEEIPYYGDWTVSLKEELAGFSAENRQIFQLNFFRHRTQKQIAKIMGISQASVSRRLQKMVSLLVK